MIVARFLVWVVRQFFCLIPRSWHYAIAHPVGRLVYWISRRHQRVSEKNLDWCFSSLSRQDRKQLTDRHVYFVGLSLFDNLVGWLWSTEKIKQTVPHRLIGFDEFLHVQKHSDQGILLIGMHSTHMELDGRFIGMHFDTVPVQRGGGYSSFLNAIIAYGRGQMAKKILSKEQGKGFIKALRDAETLVYFPDQDYGKSRSIQTTLFGEPVLLTTVPYTLQKCSNCLVYLYDSYYEGRTLVMTIEKLELPTCDAESFTEALGRCIESKIARHPAEYMWGHRRFKSTKGVECYE